MKIKASLIAALVLGLAIPSVAGDKHKKKKASDRAMIERMEAIPCGARERGVTGLGSIWASVGVQHVNSDEKLCPQYLIRTDDMEYHIRPKDGKHPVILPVGQEAIFKIKKDTLQLKVPEGDRKTRDYQVVSMKPVEPQPDRVAERTDDHSPH